MSESIISWGVFYTVTVYLGVWHALIGISSREEREKGGKGGNETTIIPQKLSSAMPFTAFTILFLKTNVIVKTNGGSNNGQKER